MIYITVYIVNWTLHMPFTPTYLYYILYVITVVKKYTQNIQPWSAVKYLRLKAPFI